MGRKRRRDEDSVNAEIGRSVREDIRVRHFDRLGWSVFVVPMSLGGPTLGGFARMPARMLVGTMFGFKPDEVIDLRARRLTFDDEIERPCWVLAIPKAAMDRRRKQPKAAT